jgi:WD40 repeat protein
MLSHTLRVHTRQVNSVAIFSDGQHIASGSYDKTINISNACTGQVTSTIRDHVAPVKCVAVSKDGTRLASGDSRGAIKVRTLKDGAVPTELCTLKGHTRCVNAVEFSPGDQKIASCSSDGTMLLWSAQSGERLQTFRGRVDVELFCLAWSPDSKLVACAGEGAIIDVVDAATGTQVRELEGGHTDMFFCCLAFGATSEVLYSGGNDCDYAIVEWNLAEGREATVTRRLQGHTQAVNGIALSPCAMWMASASDDKTVRIWNLAMGEQIRELKGHTHWVKGVKWSRDGKMIVCRSDDMTVRVWEVVAQVRGIHASEAIFMFCLNLLVDIPVGIIYGV